MTIRLQPPDGTQRIRIGYCTMCCPSRPLFSGRYQPFFRFVILGGDTISSKKRLPTGSLTHCFHWSKEIARMRRLAFALIATFLLAIVLIPSSRSAAQAQASDGRPDQVVLKPTPGTGAPGIAASGDYLSPPTQAPRPFTHLLIRREAHVPDGASLALFVRASVDGASWGDWVELTENDDLWAATDGPDVEWSQTIAAGTLARFWQVRSHAEASPAGEQPELRSIDVNTTDASGPAPSAPRTDGANLVQSKPAVVSRVGWGSPDGQGSRVAPYYYPVNHMVVHHTADSNSLLPGESGWAARVRAEWSFHTYTRGWGDV